MSAWRLTDDGITRLHQRARAERWSVSADAFAAALERSARKAFTAAPDPRALEKYLTSLHLDDLALACACAQGHAGAWEHFVREHRPVLYRAADAIDPTGGARELADSLYGELFGVAERAGERRSLFEYFHGRSSLATWLRAVLAQRHVDRVRTVRRYEPLPEEDDRGAAAPDAVNESRVAAWVQLLRRAVTAAVARLAPRDRLRLGYYYAEDLTLAQIGRALGEHEATVSRNLAKARREIRADVERQLREGEHMSRTQIDECFAAVVDDARTLDVADLLSSTGSRKDSDDRRSKERAEGASA